MCIRDSLWDGQVGRFLEITSLLDLEKIPIVHMGSGVSLLAHPKIPFANGARMGLVMYGYNIAPSSLKGGLKNKLRAVRNAYFRKKYNISCLLYTSPARSFCIRFRLYPPARCNRWNAEPPFRDRAFVPLFQLSQDFPFLPDGG